MNRTKPHWHPDSVMYTLSSFRRWLISGDQERSVEIAEGTVSWVPAQEHSGENIGDTETRVIFVELKGSSTESEIQLGPQIGLRSRPSLFVGESRNPPLGVRAMPISDPSIEGQLQGDPLIGSSPRYLLSGLLSI